MFKLIYQNSYIKAWLLVISLVIIISLLLVLLNYFGLVHIFNFNPHSYNYYVVGEWQEISKSKYEELFGIKNNSKLEEIIADILEVTIRAGAIIIIGEHILDFIWFWFKL